MLYLGFTGVVAMLVVAPAYAVSRVGVVRTAHANYVFPAEQFQVALRVALLLGCPALLLMAGRIVFGWTTPQLGLCRRGGYDLRASTERCPECGTPIGAERET